MSIPFYISEIMHALDGDLEDRAKNAREKAERVFYGVSDDESEHMMRLWLYLSREYNIPLFSEYFKNRTFDDLIFEIELIGLFKKSRADSAKTSTDSMKSIASKEDNRKELEQLAMQWEEEDRVQNEYYQRQAELSGSATPQDNQENLPNNPKSENGWQEMPADDNIMSDDEFAELEKQFMETNDFVDPSSQKGDKNDK